MPKAHSFSGKLGSSPRLATMQRVGLMRHVCGKSTGAGLGVRSTGWLFTMASLATRLAHTFPGGVKQPPGHMVRSWQVWGLPYAAPSVAIPT